MVHQTGQDTVQIESAADVAGDPTQGFRPMDQVSDLTLADDHANQGPQHIAQHGCQIQIFLTQAGRTVGDDQQDAPRSACARDGNGQFGSLAGQGGASDSLVSFGEDGDRRVRGMMLRSRVSAGGGIERPPEHANVPRHVKGQRHGMAGRCRGGAYREPFGA